MAPDDFLADPFALPSNVPTALERFETGEARRSSCSGTAELQEDP